MSRILNRRLFNAIVVLAVAGLATFGLMVGSASATTGPSQSNFNDAYSYSTSNGGTIDPPGANNWSCVPTAAHPNPVVLVHGTFENKYDNWSYISPALASAGYCVF